MAGLICWVLYPIALTLYMNPKYEAQKNRVENAYSVAVRGGNLSTVFDPGSVRELERIRKRRGDILDYKFKGQYGSPLQSYNHVEIVVRRKWAVETETCIAEGRLVYLEIVEPEMPAPGEKD